MADDLHWTQTEKGFVLSSFFCGYFLSGVPGGYLADRFGGKRVLTVASIFWSIFTMLTPTAARSSYASLLLIRILLGLAEGMAWPAIHSLVAVWFPPNEVSRAVSFFTSGAAFGTVITVLASPPMIAHYEWPVVFYFFGALGCAFTVIWHLVVFDTPADHVTISTQERDLIQANIVAWNGVDVIPWKLLFTAKQLWAFYLNMFASGWGFFVLLAWMPDYFHEAMNVDIEEVGYYSVAPYLCQIVVGPLSGVISDWLITRHHYTRETVATLMQLTGLMAPAFFLILLGYTAITPVLASVYLTLALALNASTSAGVCVYHLAVLPQFAGLVYSIGNTFSIIPAIVGIAASGSLLDVYHSWTMVFTLAIVSYIMGALAWLALARGPIVGMETSLVGGSTRSTDVSHEHEPVSACDQQHSGT